MSIKLNLTTTNIGLKVAHARSGMDSAPFLTANASAGATTISVNALPTGVIDSGFWAVIDPWTSQAEIRKVTGISGLNLTVAALSYSHAENDAVIFLSQPVFGSGLFNNSDTLAEAAVPAYDKLTMIGTPLKIKGNYTYPSSVPATIQGQGTSDSGPAVLLLIKNTADVASATDYENEVHLRLQAGTSADHRKYINFADKSGVDQWVTGSNASHVWILYDRYAHRLWFEQNGRSYINAADDKGVYVGYHATDTVGTGGFFVYRGGGISGNNLVFGVQLSTAGNMDSQTNVYVNAGASAAQNGYFVFQSIGTAKYYLGKHNSNSFALYDLANSEYALWWDVTVKGLAIGHAIPAARLHPITIDALTDSVADVAILGHSTSGTPAAGFGPALLFQGEDASVDKREMGRIRFEWVSATDASRASRGRVTAFSTTTEQEAIRWDGDSGGVKLGFYGGAAVAKQTVTGSRGANAALADLLTKLATLGLITDSTS